MKRIVLRLVIIIVISGLIIFSVLVIKNNKDKAVGPSQSNETSQINSVINITPTPIPTQEVLPTTQPEPTTSEPDTGEILFEKKIDLNNDKVDETVQIEKIKSKTDSQGYEGVLKITDKEHTIKASFLNRTQESLTGVFTSVEFKDLDGDGVKDIFITIPDVGAEFNISYFFAYNYKNQKAYSYNYDNMDLVGNLIQDFKLNYSGNGLLTVKNEKFNFTADISLKDNAGFSDSDKLNKSTYDKAWISPQSIDLDQNAKLILMTTSKNQQEIKVPFIIFGQATSDILGEIDTFFSFNNDFKPILKRFEVHEFHGNKKNMVGKKILN